MFSPKKEQIAIIVYSTPPLKNIILSWQSLKILKESFKFNFKKYFRSCKDWTFANEFFYRIDGKFKNVEKTFTFLKFYLNKVYVKLTRKNEKERERERKKNSSSIYWKCLEISLNDLRIFTVSNICIIKDVTKLSVKENWFKSNHKAISLLFNS